MAALGHPIIGDLFYGPRHNYYLSNRLLLHAEELRIKHPRLKYDIQFRAPCPFTIDDCAIPPQIPSGSSSSDSSSSSSDSSSIAPSYIYSNSESFVE